MELLANWFTDWFFDWFGPDTWKAVGSVTLWVAEVLLLVVGFLGTFIPILPGTALIFAGSLLHYFGRGMEDSGLSWQGLVLITLFFVASLVLDWLSGALGAKYFGSSKWGIAGALLGALVGLFFGLPGIIIGPIAGVFAFEMIFAKKELKDASNSTVGTVVGGLAGIVARVLLALAMIACFCVDIFSVN